MAGWRKALTVASMACSGFAVLLALVVLFGNTGTGERTIEWLVWRLSGGEVSLQGLSGRFPESPRAAKLELRDAKGVWLSAEDISLHWAPLAYLWNKIAIDDVTARRIDVLRRPIRSSTSEGEGPPIRIARLSVDRLQVSEAVAFRKMAITLAGSMDYHSLDEARIGLAARRLDKPGTYRIDADISENGIKGAAVIREPAGGLIAGLLDLPDLGPLILDAHASGPRKAQAIVVAMQAGALRLDARGLVDLLGRTAKADIVAQAPAMTPGPGLSWSSLSFKAHMQGSFERPFIDGHLRIADLAAGDGRASLIEGTIAGRNGDVGLHARIEGAEWNGLRQDFFEGTPIELRGRMNFTLEGHPADFELSHRLLRLQGMAHFGNETRLEAKLTVPALAPFASLAGLDLMGRAEATFQAQEKNGTITEKLDGTLSLTGEDMLSRLIGRNGKLSLEGVTEKENILLQRAELQGSFVQLAAKGELENEKLRFDWTAQLHDLRKVVETLNGDFALRGHLKGRTDDFEITLAGDGRVAGGSYAKGPMEFSARIGGLPEKAQGEVDAKGKVNGSPLSLRAKVQPEKDGTQVAIEKADWKSFRARGVLLFARGKDLPSGKITIREGALADVAPFVGTALSGNVAATADISPARAKIEMTGTELVIENIRAGQMALTGSIADPANKAFADLDFRVRGLTAYGFAGDADLRLAGPKSAMDIRLGAQLADENGEAAKIDANAELDAADGAMTLKTFTANYRGETIRLAAPAHIGFAKAVTIDRLALEAADAKASLSGRISPNLDLSAAFTNAGPRLVKMFVPDFPIEGVVSAQAQLSGTQDDLHGTITLTGQNLAYQGAGGPKSALKAKVVLNGKTADIEMNLSGALSLGISGTAPLAMDGPVALGAKGSADLALANAALNAEGRNLRGKITLDGTLTGSLSHPIAEGTALLEKADYQDYVQGIHITDISGRIAARGSTIALSEFTARAGKGTLSAKGEIDIAADGMPVRFSVTAKNARLLSGNLMTMDGDADLSLSGKAQSLVELSGKVRIERGEVNLPETMPRNVAVLDVHRKGERKVPPRKSRMPVIGLDLAVSSPGRLFVRGRGLEAELSGRVTAKGTTEAPDMRGGFTMRRGEISLAGQTLNFTSGRLAFDGAGLSGKLDPSLNFVAETASGNVTAKLEVTGYVSAPKIKLSSTPYLPQDEILARLLFQQSVKELGPLQVAQIAEGLSSLTGVASGLNPLSRVRKGLGLDRLAVSSGQSGSGASVEAGKYVMNGVYIGTKQDTAGGTTAKVQVDLTRRLKAQATVTTGTPPNVTGSAAQVDRGSSIGLSYQFDY